MVEYEDIDKIPFPIKLFKRRWVMLFIFGINSFGNACLFSALPSINNLVCKYYNVSSPTIDWLANTFSLMVILISLPSAYVLQKFGLRFSLIVCSSLNALATCFRFAAANQDGFAFIIIGNFLAALPVGFVFQIPPLLSAVWFGVKETAIATCISISFNSLGIGFGFIQATYMVNPSPNIAVVGNGLHNMHFSQMIFMLTTFIFTILIFENEPKIPPSNSRLHVKNNDNEAIVFFKSLKQLLKNRNFMFLTQTYSMVYGVLTLLLVSLNPMLSNFVEDRIIGWMGFILLNGGFLVTLIMGKILDQYKCYHFLSSLITFLIFAAWALFTNIFIFVKSLTYLVASVFFLGLLFTPFLALGFEQAAEMTYPISEGTSSSFLVISSNVYSFIFLLVFGNLIDSGHTNLVSWICLGFLLAALIISLFTTTKKQRMIEENSTIEKNCILVEQA